jgi:DNA helicase II / ATP-dependent DNA helicase PcrA
VCLRRAVVIGFVDGTACKRALAVWPGDTHQKTEVASTDVSWQPGDRPIYVRQPGRERLWAAEAVERIIRLSVREPGEPDKGVGPEVLDDRWLREAAIRLAISLDPVGKTPAAYAAAVRAHLQQVDWPGELTIAPNLGSLLRAPTASEWLVEAEVPGAFRAATIHSVKGQEFPGVVVVLPSNLLKDGAGLHAVDHWESQTACELRRVVYVGGSRAQQLLVLAVHETHLERLAGLLDRDAVPYDRHEPTASRRRRRG